MPDSPPSPTCVVMEPTRRRGRPPVAQRLVSVTTWLPSEEADQLIRDARRCDVTVSELLRFVVLTLPRERT